MGNDFVVKIVWLLIAIFMSIFGLWLLYVGFTERSVMLGVIGAGVLLGEILFFRMTAR